MDSAASELIPGFAADSLAQSYIGSRALMFDAPGEFEIAVQQRIWSLADHLAQWSEVEEVVGAALDTAFLAGGRVAVLLGQRLIGRKKWER